MEVSVDGNDCIIKIDEFLNNKLPEGIEEALEKACLIVENSAKQNCPTSSGQLRQSITHQVEDKVGRVGTNVEYAPYVEIGTGIYSTQGNGRQTPWKYQDAKGDWHTTRGMRAQPYLRPALDSNLSEIQQCFEGLIK